MIKQRLDKIEKIIIEEIVRNYHSCSDDFNLKGKNIIDELLEEIRNLFGQEEKTIEMYNLLTEEELMKYDFGPEKR